MHVMRGMRQLVGSLGLTALSLGVFPATAHARPLPGAAVRDPFRLNSRSITSIAVNRVSYGLNTKGEIGSDSLGRGTFGGGFWPRGTANEYMYNSGIQLAGVVEGTKSATNPWGGDTAAARFFDANGSGKSGEEVTQAFRSFDPGDNSIWPDAANVPDGDAGAELYDPLLRGKRAASQGDLWFLSWEGNPGFVTGRTHPMGIVVEHRLMQWTYPAGNDDVMYLVATAYNVTTTDASAYEAHRPSLRPYLLQKAADFIELNNAAYDIDLPAAGMTYDPFYMAWSSDPDVGVSNRNTSGVNFPFGLGYIYQTDFTTAPGWVFPPEIFSAPFFPGVGFFGAKYLKAPDGGHEIALFSSTINGGDPAGAPNLFRFMKADGGGPTCNVASPLINKVCFIDINGTPRDLRFFQSSNPVRLEPGASTSLVVAYVHAAPVKLNGYNPVANQFSGQQFIPAGKVLWISRADSIRIKGGVTRVDSLMGFQAYLGPFFDNFTNDTGTGPFPDSVAHTPRQEEFKVVPSSILAKSLVAQLIFDNKFLLPFAPSTPEFFVVPGVNKATILWRPTASEAEGDAYAAVASLPNLANGSPNSLYDPNFRPNDVEGYRVYRGRSDNPASLKLLAQWDYAGTTITDFGGNIMRELTECAPELGQTDSVLYKCPRNFLGPITPGVLATRGRTFDLTTTTGSSGLLVAGPVIQVLYGQRFLLASGKLFYTAADTIMSGAYYVQQRGADGVGYPALANTSVPFTFVDSTRADCPECGVINGVNYYYAVTAFDVNSLRSGPVSLESARSTKQVTIGSVASNFDNSFTAKARIVGRSVRTDDVMPVLDPVTGRFNKAFPPTNSMSIKLAAFIPELLKGSGAVGIRLDSIGRPTLNNGASTSIAPYYITVIPATGAGSLEIPSFPVTINTTINATTATGTTGITTDSISGGYVTGGPGFDAMKFDPTLVSVYGGAETGYTATATWTMRRQRNYYVGTWGRGCANTGSTPIPGFFFNVTARCFYNGPRWYSGTNETMDDPTGATPWVFNPALVSPLNYRYGNAGRLDGVVTTHFPAAYGMVGGLGWRSVEIALAHFVTAADYSVFWGAAGAIDSVVDLTHDLQVPFRTDMNASWGILNSTSVPQSMRYSRRDVLTVTDVSCTWPLKRYQAVNTARTLGVQFDSTSGGDLVGIPCQAPRADSANQALAIPLENRAVPGPIAFVADTLDRVKRIDAAPRAANDGFLMYLKGRIYMFELAGGQVPAAGTRWNLRDYVGAISGGKGDAGDLGPYRFYAVGLPFTAVGATAEFKFDVANVVAKPSAAAMAKIKTVPDPYYVTSAYDQSITLKVIKFLNVPTGATVRIYSSAGILVTELRNNNVANDGTVAWNVRNRSNQFVASGPYYWVVNIDGVLQSGRMVVVNNAANVN